MTPAELSDRYELLELHNRYVTAVDTKAWSMLASVFTTSAVLDFSAFGGVQGPLKDVSAWMEESLSRFKVLQHFVTNTSLDLNGDTASGRCYVLGKYAHDRDGARAVYSIGGQFTDKFIRTPDGWRIYERIFHRRWVDGPAPDWL